MCVHVCMRVRENLSLLKWLSREMGKGTEQKQVERGNHNTLAGKPQQKHTPRAHKILQAFAFLSFGTNLLAYFWESLRKAEQKKKKKEEIFHNL